MVTVPRLLWLLALSGPLLAHTADPEDGEAVEEILAEDGPPEERPPPPGGAGGEKEAPGGSKREGPGGSKREGPGGSKREGPRGSKAGTEAPGGSKAETPKAEAPGASKAGTEAPGGTETGGAVPGGPEAGKEGEAGDGDEATVEDGEDGEAKGEVEEPPKEEEEEHEAPSGVRDPRPCEVCKYLAVELQGRLVETGKVKEHIITGHGIMPGDRKKKDYKKSELRFIEALQEPHVCDKILGYDIHAERSKSLRYAKGPSETRTTLKALVHKGVKVELGIPQELWYERDGPPNEITHLQRLCVNMVERHEEDIEDWYWGYQETSLLDYLCRERALTGQDIECLKEEFVPPPPREEKEEEPRDKNALPEAEETKGDPGVPDSATPPSAPDPTPPLPSQQATPPADSGHSIKQTPPPGTTAMPRTAPPPTATASPGPQTAREEL